MLNSLALALGLMAGIVGSPATSATTPPEFVVAIGDELLLDFLDDDAAPYSIKVGFRGEVQLPFLGTVEIADLTITDARDRITALYVKNQIFVAPQIELSVVNLRPVSVLGDVRTPGLVDYMPFLTVEQAVGLAGGAASPGNNEESRTIQRASLRGELASLDSGLAQEMVARARVQSQLAGKDMIDPSLTAIPKVPDLDPALLEQLRTQEEEILRSEGENYAAQVDLLDQSIAEAQHELELIKEQIATQTKRIESYAGEMAMSLKLTEQGLQAAPARARLERQVADEDNALLRLQSYQAQTQRAITGIQRERQTLVFGRQQAWREDLSARQVKIAQLLAQRQSMINQLNLLADWTERMADQPGEVQLDYRVRRRSKEGFETSTAGATDELRPGDVVLVRVTAPDAPSEALLQ